MYRTNPQPVSPPTPFVQHGTSIRRHLSTAMLYRRTDGTAEDGGCYVPSSALHAAAAEEVGMRSTHALSFWVAETGTVVLRTCDARTD